MIDEPEGIRHLGGDVAGPVFTRVMGGVLRLYSVPQDMQLPAEGLRMEQGMDYPKEEESL